MSSENWKLEKDLCRCCHSDGSFKNLAEPFTISDVVEIYADMLKECYDIDMAPVPGMLSAVTYTICEVCVIRLRDAADFKKQVQSCEERFKDMYNKNIIKGADALDIEVEVKQEIPDSEPDDDFKDDFPQDINDDDDFDESMDLKINDEDEKPVEEEEVTTKKKYNTRPRTTVKKPTVKSAPVKSAPVKKSPVKSKKKTKRKNLKPKSADTENDAEAKQGRVMVLLQSAGRVVAPSLAAGQVVAPFWSEVQVVKPKFFVREEDFKKDGEVYHCAKCEKTYTKIKSMRWHVKSMHYKIPRYKCEICIETFMTLPLLTVHKLEVHNVDDRVKCSLCDKMFNTKRHLRNHIKNFHMHGEVGTRYKCEFCDFVTFKNVAMYKHRFKHKTVKDYHCRFCKKSFKRRATLNLHERIHTDDRRKVCTECGQAFVQKASLNYHMTKNHPDVNF